jgi:hypothetical protein
LSYRIRAVAVATLTLISSLLAVLPADAVVTPQKVVIIVGPVGAGTDNYRSQADSTAAVASAAGATVVKVYSPNATWAKVKAAVNGANIVIYMGHGNGFPNPYTSPPNSTSATELTDRDNGWGLNRTTSGGDGDNWSTTMVYCGEKALLGTLTSSDGAAQRTYCSGGPVTPAAHWVMIYADACYAPGASESWDTKATESLAYQHVRNYSYPALRLGASAYYATDFGADGLVDSILRNPSLTWTDITRAADGYDAAAQRHFTHPDVSNAQIWIQRTSYGGDNLDYYLAFAGNPFATPEGGIGTPLPVAPLVISKGPASGATGVSRATTVTATFDQAVSAVSGNSFTLRVAGGASVPATVSYDGAHLRATLTPASALAYGTKYTASLTSAIVNASDLSLVPVSWSFTVQTDPATSPPTLVSRWPAPNATGITMSPTVTVRFSEPITGLSTGNMILRVASSGATVAAAVAYDPATLTATLRPNAPLQPATSYKMGMSGSIKDLAGNSLAWTTWTFKTTASETYNPARVLKFAAGTYTAYQFSSSGAVLAHKTYTLGKASSAHTTKRAAIPAHSGGWYYISDGVWAGYWMREGTGITLG